MKKPNPGEDKEAYEKALAASSAWKKRNKLLVKEYSDKWNAENKQLKKELKAKWDAANPERRKEHMDRLREKNPNYFSDRHLHYTYGITGETYAGMVLEQGNLCAACGTPASETQRKKLFVDHCHTTGKIRGLLCQKCNTALGMVEDDVTRLAALISYLLQSSNT